MGHNVIAFTEHESISNAIKVEEYYNKVKKEHPDFKIILGNEIYLCRDGLNKQNFSKENGDKYYHFILLAKDAIGHKQIREVSTRAWSRSYKTGKMTRVPTYYQDLVDIIGENPGHVVGSSGCLGGYLPTQLLRIRDSENQDYSKLYEWLNLMMKIFPNGDFYLELQPSDNEEQIYVNKKMLELSKEFGVSYIITNDSHYQRKEDAPIHKAYLTSQEGEREVDEFYKTTYLMNTDELESFFKYFTEEEIQKAYQTIVEIKNKCSDYSLKKPLKIPSLIWKKPSIKAKEYLKKYLPLIPNLKYFIESDFNGDNIMAELIADKLESDSRLQDEKIYNELNSNLETTWISSEVNKAHWSAYFLNLQKTLDVCWDAGTIVSPGRGSGVGFLLLYILDIIQINPMWEKAQTKPWRFLNPSRVSVLD